MYIFVARTYKYSTIAFEDLLQFTIALEIQPAGAGDKYQVRTIIRMMIMVMMMMMMMKTKLRRSRCEYV